MDEFKIPSCLQADTSKIEVFFSGEFEGTKDQILSFLRFIEAQLHLRYLGLNLIYGKMSSSDCKPIIEKISARINSWCARKLSFAERLQLIQSMLCGIQVERTNTSFFQLKSSKRSKGASTDFYGQVLVLWSLASELHEMWISLVDQEDRGLKSSRTGIGLMTDVSWHIWDLLIVAGSLWVAWVHTYLLKRQKILECPHTQ